jgi:hypothetical protein
VDRDIAIARSPARNRRVTRKGLSEPWRGLLVLTQFVFSRSAETTRPNVGVRNIGRRTKRLVSGKGPMPFPVLAAVSWLSTTSVITSAAFRPVNASAMPTPILVDVVFLQLNPPSSCRLVQPNLRTLATATTSAKKDKTTALSNSGIFKPLK